MKGFFFLEEGNLACFHIYYVTPPEQTSHTQVLIMCLSTNLVGLLRWSGNTCVAEILTAGPGREILHAANAKPSLRCTYIYWGLPEKRIRAQRTIHKAVTLRTVSLSQSRMHNLCWDPTYLVTFFSGPHAVVIITYPNISFRLMFSDRGAAKGGDLILSAWHWQGAQRIF